MSFNKRLRILLDCCGISIVQNPYRDIINQKDLDYLESMAYHDYETSTMCCILNVTDYYLNDLFKQNDYTSHCVGSGFILWEKFI